MGGAFIDCNKLFCQLSNYSKQEVCSMTIFNLTARQDLQHAFDLISQMLSAPTDASSGASSSSTCVLRGALKHRNDLGLSVTLIKGEDGVAKCFCVTLVLNPVSPFDNPRPIPATVDCIFSGQQQQLQGAKNSAGGMDPAPAYTTGWDSFVPPGTRIFLVVVQIASLYTFTACEFVPSVQPRSRSNESLAWS